MTTTTAATSEPAFAEPGDFRPVGDYGLLADCTSAALVDRSGSIDWLCLPRYDSSALFARLLDPGGLKVAIVERELVDAAQAFAWRDFMVSDYDARVRCRQAMDELTPEAGVRRTTRGRSVHRLRPGTRVGCR